MEKKLDQLFRDKLSNHNITPSVDAWEKINSGLRPKRNPVSKWMAVAAILLLVGFAGAVGYFYFQGAGQETQIAGLETSNPAMDISQSENISEPGPETFMEQSTEPVKENNPEPESVLTPVVKKRQTLVQKQINPDPEQLTQRTGPDGIVPLENQDSQILAINDGPVHESLTFESGLPVVDDHEIKVASENPAKAPKTYPKVTVTYKVSSDSPLLAQTNNKVIDKGMKEIARFSEKHIITDELKSKLRNTKDDLLALNFGRIINKSNKDIEN